MSVVNPVEEIVSSYGSNHRRTGSVSPPYESSNSHTSAYTTPRRSGSPVLAGPKRRFKSYRLRGEYEKPWLQDPSLKKIRYNNWIVMSFIVLGFLLAALVCYLNVRKYQTGPMCLFFEDDFATLDPNVWTHEVTLNGFGTGSFDWTTTDSKNAYVDSEGLHIVPTLTNESTSITNDQLYSGYTLNLTSDGTCTDTSATACVASSDPEKGSMIPPVRSARLITKGSKTLRYGRVEVEAKMPKGDWLWPAIWMMPTDSVYGVWPRSGEIDIMESRGNDYTYPSGGRDYYYGSLHWGPSSDTDAYWRTTSAKSLKRSDFSEGFHTFGLEWDDSYMYFYLDNRLTQILFVGFGQNDDLWQKGKFSAMNSTMSNPWAGSNSTTGNAPFDESFYLILNVAVGAKNGWFLDNIGNKPWLDSATNAQWTFWSAADEWLPTWGEGNQRGMTVRSVRMWSKGACGSDL